MTGRKNPAAVAPIPQVAEQPQIASPSQEAEQELREALRKQQEEQELIARQREDERIAREAEAARDEATMAQAKRDYPLRVEHFRNEVRRRGLDAGFDNFENFYWYHSVDLGDGLVTPGDYDFRDRLSDYPFPADMSGTTALDVGSATGFFAFEFERRGADVTSVDLPSIANWDMVSAGKDDLYAKWKAYFRVSTIPAVDWAHEHGPFGFCHKLLNSRVKRVLSRIYDLTPQNLEREQFDLIFLGDILGHLFSPLAALNTLAPLCRKQMIISLDLVDLPAATLLYGGGESETGDGRSWFQPNWEALRQMLRRVGFRSVERVGKSRVLACREWQWLSRDLIVATK